VKTRTGPSNTPLQAPSGACGVRQVFWISLRRLRLIVKPLSGWIYEAGESLQVRDVVRHLEEGGWRPSADQREPQTVQAPSKAATVTVAGKPGVDVPPGTLNAILKQSGLKK